MFVLFTLFAMSLTAHFLFRSWDKKHTAYWNRLDSFANCGECGASLANAHTHSSTTSNDWN